MKDTHLAQYIVRLRFLWLALSLAVVTTLILVACGGTETTAQPSPTTVPTTAATTASTPVAVVNVKIIEQNGKYGFSPSTLTVKAGTQVVWTNDSDAAHTVTSDKSTFNTTSNLTQNQTFSFIFTTPGTYTYHCNIHTYMTGTITVTS